DEWKPESPDRFGDIAELVKSIDSLKVEDVEIQGGNQSSKSSPGKGSKSSHASTKATIANLPTQKADAHRPPHSKNAEVIGAEAEAFLMTDEGTLMGV
ncbi:hypothetical protein U1Q18_003454, partial [Sarracenia purpurea var. burkii]